MVAHVGDRFTWRRAAVLSLLIQVGVCRRPRYLFQYIAVNAGGLLILFKEWAGNAFLRLSYACDTQ
jgi:hypothetical protein